VSKQNNGNHLRGVRLSCRRSQESEVGTSLAARLATVAAEPPREAGEGSDVHGAKCNATGSHESAIGVGNKHEVTR